MLILIFASCVCIIIWGPNLKTEGRKAVQIACGSCVDPVWILRGSCGDPVGIRVRFLWIRVLRGVWRHRFLYILGVKTPDRLFPFIKLKGEGEGRGSREAVGPSAVPSSFAFRILPALWLGSVLRKLEFYRSSGWGFPLWLPA